MTQKSKTLLFAGSFNPFTHGHLRLVERALPLADRIVIAIGYNADKHPESDVRQRLADISNAVAPLSLAMPEKEITVTSYSGLTADFAKKTGADFLLRGVRNITDFEYERNLADINLKILGIDTILLVAEPEYGFISSSAVRELKANGFDTSSLLP